MVTNIKAKKEVVEKETKQVGKETKSETKPTKEVVEKKTKQVGKETKQVGKETKSETKPTKEVVEKKTKSETKPTKEVVEKETKQVEKKTKSETKPTKEVVEKKTKSETKPTKEVVEKETKQVGKETKSETKPTKEVVGEEIILKNQDFENDEFIRKLKEIAAFFWRNPKASMEILDKQMPEYIKGEGDGRKLNIRYPTRFYFIQFPLFDFKNTSGVTFSLFKVGESSLENKHDRPNQVISEVKTKFGMMEGWVAPNIWVYEKPTSNIETDHKTESRVRQVGDLIDAEYAKLLGLPVHTEWCIINSTVLEQMKTAFEKSIKDGLTPDTQLLNGMKFTGIIPQGFYDRLKEICEFAQTTTTTTTTTTKNEKKKR